MLINQNKDEYRLALLPYSSALKTLNTQLEILNEEKAASGEYNPIEHVKSRVKSRKSIARKLIKKGYEPTIENAIEQIDDIAGMRIICSFTEDIYKIADFLKENPVEIAVIATQKESAEEVAATAVELGIRSLWNFAPVDLSFGEDVAVENINMSESLYMLAYKNKNLL